MKFLLKLKLWLSVFLSFLILYIFCYTIRIYNKRNEIKIEKIMLTDEEFKLKKNLN